MQKQTTKNLLNDWIYDRSFYARKEISSEEKLKVESSIKALSIFKKASKQIPAYRNFLHKHKIDPQKIRTIKDFSNVPATTKENYVERYSLEDRCWRGVIDDEYMISTSSGTTGKPHYWPRDMVTEIEGARAHEYIFREICAIGTKRVLFINGFALGNWIAGTFTDICVKLVSIKGYNITSMTPGYSAEAILSVLRDIPKYFDIVIISGHTPFLKELTEKAREESIDMKKTKFILLGTGQSVTENWRDYIIETVSSEDIYRTFINLYGSADAALMGFETPLSIYLRRYLVSNASTAKLFFSDSRIPAIYQYDPRLTFFEEISNELHITKYSGTPLIKYNIKDNGGLFDLSDINKHLPSVKNLEHELGFRINRLPFVYLYGREKFMAKIYGANIYTEHVQHALNHKSLQEYVTGKFILTTEDDKNHNPVLIVRIECRAETKSSDKVKVLVSEIIFQEVSKQNSEYRDVYSRMKDKVKPHVLLHAYQDAKYFPSDKLVKTA